MVDGLTATALDTSATASGAVFHLGSLEDFNGFYYEVDMPVGRPAGELKRTRRRHSIVRAALWRPNRALAARRSIHP